MLSAHYEMLNEYARMDRSEDYLRVQTESNLVMDQVDPDNLEELREQGQGLYE